MGEIVVRIPGDLAGELAALAPAVGVEVCHLLLAAHVKVANVMTGEQRVTVACGQFGSWSLCETEVPDGRWLDLVHAVAAAAGPAMAAPVPAGMTGATTVYFDGGSASEGTDPRMLLLWHDPAQFGAAEAARVAGYHLAALRSMAQALDAPHRASCLLDDAEVRFQIRVHDAGRRSLPGRRFHELFEERAVRHPDVVAMTCGDASITYGTLNRAANRVAHSLLDAGIAAEDVVAVVTERNLDWAAAVLGVFKAGAAYLPVDPAYPAERAAMMLKQSGARIALAGAESLPAAKAAAGCGDEGIAIVPLAAQPGTRDDDPCVRVAARQLAYIYFTSGSTGLPKGAMCDHLGMLNHLLAKLDVLGLDAGDVVVQNAGICFDISLWQLITVLLAGGRTAIVGHKEILDTRRFVDTVTKARATVVQVVPSYLDVLLADIEAGARGFGRVRCVSVTGEAISKQLVERWFARFPGIVLVNAYGATEASDDTTHMVLDGPPQRALVPVGRPIANVNIYVMNEESALVPLGAPGEIVFSGICVGRGYIGDPERTKKAFPPDPLRPGQRMYRTGDYGRWLADGNLEFLGRRDDQVKIRGMRVETGEVEGRIRAVGGVRAATVIAQESGLGKSLVAFFTADPAVSAPHLLSVLRGALPAHLVPAACHKVAELPLTENGKIDKKALSALAGELAQRTPERKEPATPSERRMAVAWAEILARPLDEISAGDDFFEIGGDSLAALRLVVKLDRVISLTDLIQNPVLRDLAGIAGGEQRPHASKVRHPLAVVGPDAPRLICVPDAGGNAVNYQRLASALAGGRINVEGIELPRHDVATAHERLAGIPDIARRIAAEFTEAPAAPIVLWGHGSGVAIAIETAKVCAERGRDVRAVCAGGFVPPAAPTEAEARMRAIDLLSDEDVKAALSADAGFTEVDELRPERAVVVGAAYRHDMRCALGYFADLLTLKEGPCLNVPLLLVAAGDDLAAAGGRLEELWTPVASDITVETLPETGRHFHRTEPARTAEIAERHIARWCATVRPRPATALSDR